MRPLPAARPASTAKEPVPELSDTAASTLGAHSKSAPSSRGPERPANENRLEDQPHCPRGIGIQPERIGTLHKLSDIPREDRNEESGRNQSDDHPVLRCQQQRCPNEDLDNPRDHHDEVGIYRQPVRNLRQKLTPRRRKVAQACQNERCSEKKPERRLNAADWRLVASSQEAVNEPNHF